MTKICNLEFGRPVLAVSLGLVLACGGGGDTTDTATTGTGESASTGGTSTAPPGETGGSSGGSVTPTSGGPGETTNDGSSSGSSVDTASTGTETTATSEDTGAETTAPDTTGGAVAMSFFVSSTGHSNGNLGGLFAADELCQMLADGVGADDKTWHAYLSIEKGLDDGPVHARDRIGAGPWYNQKLELLATDLESLHALEGDADLFLDENGEKVPGQWMGSPMPNEHDILTGSDRDGMLLVGKTCEDWTSESAMLFAQVGHSDGLGPGGDDSDMYRPWNSVHESGGCNDTAPKGGAGRIYCFAID